MSNTDNQVSRTFKTKTGDDIEKGESENENGCNASLQCQLMVLSYDSDRVSHDSDGRRPRDTKLACTTQEVRASSIYSISVAAAQGYADFGLVSSNVTMSKGEAQAGLDQSKDINI